MLVLYRHYLNAKNILFLTIFTESLELSMFRLNGLQVLNRLISVKVTFLHFLRSWAFAIERMILYVCRELCWFLINCCKTYPTVQKHPFPLWANLAPTAFNPPPLISFYCGPQNVGVNGFFGFIYELCISLQCASHCTLNVIHFWYSFLETFILSYSTEFHRTF